MAMYWLALTLLPTGTSASLPTRHTLCWAASPVVARLEAERNRSGIIAVVGGGFNSSYYSYVLGEPGVRNYAAQYALLPVRDPGTYDGLIEQPPVSFGPHLAVVSPKGEVMARINGYPRARDIRILLKSMQGCLDGSPISPEGRVHLAMSQQNDKGAMRIATQAARTSSRDAADCYGAIGDELRVRGEIRQGIESYRTALRYANDPSQRVRWALRLSVSEWRLGESVQAAARLRSMANAPELPAGDRKDVVEMMARLSVE